MAAFSDICEDEPGRQDGEAIELAANNVLREIYAPGVGQLQKAVHKYDLSDITLVPSLLFVAYAVEELAVSLEPSTLGDHSDLSRLAFAALEAVEAINYAEKLILHEGAAALYERSEREKQAVKAKLTKGYAHSLGKIKKAKDNAIVRAQVIATELWEAEGSEKTLITTMADKVYRALVSEGFSEQLPGVPERLKQWIKPIAPASASRRGRPKMQRP